MPMEDTMTATKRMDRPSGTMLSRRQACALGTGAAASLATGLPNILANATDDTDTETRVDAILTSMTLEQKVAQLIMPAMRTWEDGGGVLDLGDAPGLAEALRQHQYCGVILFGSNLNDTEQAVRLVSDLQRNNAEGANAKATFTIPYLVAADQEGGSVARLSMGTRGTGSMAIGATGEDGYRNARDTGVVFGQELAALGINVDLGPCADVIGDLCDPGMSTRVFSDDPETVSDLAWGFSKGLAKCRVIACLKHFPGAGDGSDFPTSESATLDELREQGLMAFSALVEKGADMIMTSAVTFPAFDDPQTLADGTTQGHYPATMSQKIVEGLLRDELGFDGVVITDALEMEQFVTEPDTGAQLLPGTPHGVAQGVEIALRCLLAGCDILLIPCDLKDADAAQWYEDYLAGIVAQVGSGSIDEGRIDESVRRVLRLKETYGVLDLDVGGTNLQEAIARAQKVVGSAEHHKTERTIAEAAVTLLKGEDVLPVRGKGTHVVIIGRSSYDNTPISYALAELMEAGIVDPGAFVVDAITGRVSGDDKARTRLYIGSYYALEEGLVWPDGLSAAIAEADFVICMATTWAGADALQDHDDRMRGISRALEEAHAAGAKLVLIDNNLPVGAARFPEADAVVCSYLSSGYDVDPTTGSGSEHMRAINANAPAALRAVFGMANMPGTLPIDVHALERDEDGVWAYTDEVMFARGSGA